MKLWFNGKMGKSMSWLVIFSLLGLSGNLLAGERLGATLVVQKKDGAQEKGELIAVKQNSILLLGSSSGADVSIDVPDIKTIRIVKKSKALPGLGYGFLIGGGVGAGIGLASGNDSPGHFVMFTAGQKALIIGAVFGAVGGVVGLLVGGLGTKDEIFPIEGKSDPVIQAELMVLKRKARIPDYH
jgi:hypothetical protein